MCLDLDNFKTVNDSLGHEFGDRVLTEIGDRLRRLTSDGGFIARLGGDEFAILLEDFHDPETPTLVAQRVLEAMAAPIALAESSVQPSVSIGIGMRSRSPWAAGLRPRSESRIAFSITGPIFFSHGWIVIVRASPRPTLATCDSGTIAP